MRKLVALFFVLVCVFSLAGCASKPEYKNFEFENVSKLIVISVDGKRFEVNDTETVQQITENIVSIQFEKGKSNKNTDGFGPFIQWYDAKDNLIESVSIMGKQTILYDGFFWTATDGNIDETVINKILES